MTDDLTPERMAAHLVVSRLDIAFELSHAYEAATGWRIGQKPETLKMVEHMRALGLVEAIGIEPSAVQRAEGRGFHLSAYGLKTRRELIKGVSDGGK